MIFIKRTFKFPDSSEIRAVGADAGFISDDDHPIVYAEDYVGFEINGGLPDQAVENGITNALSNRLGVTSPVFAYEQPADHPDYDNKRDELLAKVDGTHPDFTVE